jgi:thiosulfate/3-mercaptopyruvate sulfurtransferase
MSRSGVLVDADWVQAHLGDPGVVLVEVDEDTTAHDKGHIQDAVKLDWKKGPAGPGQA